MKHAHGDPSAADAGALNLATRRLEHLINHRRNVLVSLTEENPSKKHSLQSIRGANTPGPS